MTGPEHYEEAEALLKKAEQIALGDVFEWLPDKERVRFHDSAVAAAQAHATLALAAAAALPAATRLRTVQGGSKADAAWSIAGIV